MLGTDNTLRSGHLLLLLLVTSSIILGFGYMNEMYQRIQLQTNLAIVERQTQHATSERLIIQHKEAQLQMKLAAANQERKRLEDMQEFQSQQQNAKFEKVQQELLWKIDLKDKAFAKLQDQYESLKLRYDNLHLVMEHVEKNQSRLLEKFATQSTRCMNIINMMMELCNPDKKKILKKLSFFKEKNTSMNAVTNQSSVVTKKPENTSVGPRSEGGFTKAQMSQTQAITAFLSSGGRQRHLTVDPKVIDLSLEAESTVSLGNDQSNALEPKISAQGPYLNGTAEEEVISTAKQILVTLQNDSFQNEGNLNVTISKNYKNENSTKRQKIKERWLLGFYKYLQLANSSNLASRATINITHDDEGRELNLTLLEDRKPETTTGKKTTEKTTKENLENTLNSLFNVQNTEENDKDGDIIEERKKSEEIYLTDTDKKKHGKVLQTLRRKKYLKVDNN